MQFILPVLENGVRQRHTTTLHMMLAFLLFGIGVASEGLYWFTTVSKSFRQSGPYQPFLLFGIACLLVSVSILVLSFFRKSWLCKEANSLLLRLAELALLAGGAVLFFLHAWQGPALLFAMMAAVVAFAMVRERGQGAAAQLRIDEQGIYMHPGARRRFLPWKEVAAVLLRFGTLTIELPDNRLIQQSIGEPLPDTDALEAFCREQVAAHQSERVADEW